MAYDIGPRISLKGEAEFKRSISSINDELKEYGSELKKVRSETEGQEKSTETLAKENEVLQKQLDAQTRKLDTYRAQLEKLTKRQQEEKKALEEATREFGENSKELQKAQRQYDSTQSEIRKLNQAINETETYCNNTEKAIRDNREAAAQLGTTTDQLKAKIQNQTQALDRAKSAYVQYALHNDRSSQKAEALKADIQRLSKELQESKLKLSAAQKEADELADSLDDAGESAEKAGDGFTVMKGALADLISDGIQKGAEKLVDLAGDMKDFALESEASMSKFGAQTGATAEELDAFKEQIQEMYVNDFGESLGDLGDKMAYVKQVTGEVDPSRLRELTENALTLEDTFGSDFNETVRGVNNLMYHFGITSEEAFDLFAKGSQLGLDYTGELGDNVAEYAGNFEQAGYSAEEYFQLLANGTKNGAYNLDKVNDSINEVKNRLGDGTIGESLDIFSSKTQNLYKAWENGQATMKDVIESIVGDINNCTHEQDALNMAATAFGTMGEDANLNVVRSLTSVGDELDDVNGKMEAVKQQRYDNVQASFEALGRKVQMEVIAPIAEKLLPILQDVVSFISDNLPALMPVIALFGAVLTAAFVINGISRTITSIQTIISVVQGLPSLMPILTMIKGAISGIGTAVSGLFTLIMAHPVIAVIMAIIAAVVLLYTKCEWFRDAVNAVVKAIWDVIVQICTGMVDWFTKTLPQSINSFVKSWNDGWAKVGKWFSDTWNNMVQTLQQMGSRISQCVQGIWNNITGTFSGMWNAATKWGKDLIDGFISGIQSMWNALKDKVNGVAKLISNFLHFSVPEEGPLSDFDDSGGDMMDLLIEGMESRKKALRKSLEGIAESMRAENNFVLGGGGELTVNMPVYLDSRKIQHGQNKVAVSKADANRLAKGGW